MKKLKFLSALVGENWIDDAVIEVDEHGTIVSIGNDSVDAESISAVAVPGMANVHSHAFQRSLAGLAEFHSGDRDSFWTWRSQMFEFLRRFSPDDVYGLAVRLYREMLNSGYTAVGEFHYLHNDLDGRPYANVSEMSESLIRAATDTGIRLCLLPVLYQRGGFHNEPITAGQDRFLLSADQFSELVERCRELSRNLEHVHVGVAIHSLRAVDPGIGLSVIQNLTDPETPIHIHVAEQVPEVEACLVAHGRRSVEWLFDSYPVDHRWCLIHSTHLSDRELSAIAAAKATVGLCPTTEGNLGDGFFRMREFVDAGGRFAIGGDSHVSVDPRDELRLIEYAQRLQRRERVVLGPREQSSGRFLYESAAQGGAAALGIGRGTISVGQPADMTLIDPAHPSIDRAAGDRVLDRFVFCNNGSSPVWGVVVAGKVLRRD